MLRPGAIARFRGVEAVRRETGFGIGDRQPRGGNGAALVAEAHAHPVHFRGADLEDLAQQWRHCWRAGEFQHRRPDHARFRPFGAQRVEQAAELLLESRHGMEVLGVVGADGEHDMRPGIGRQVGQDIIADLARGRRIEAGRAPAHGAAGAFGDQAGKLRGKAVFGLLDADRRCRGIAQDQQGDRRRLARYFVQDRASRRQHAGGAPPHAEALPDIDREGEPGEKGKQALHGGSVTVEAKPLAHVSSEVNEADYAQQSGRSSLLSWYSSWRRTQSIRL
ncbi:hypothetical protein MPLDJ20_190131 [Mesorhizobium plurifarium]|uniref:Uncharacterized protein n=1 Tax=Mesorhizobium plurifarium TaxID=69974 RepID=A0A090ETJ9_MESPL|nr:hypothetical protein MPLDJ20_190131 [Mesorhizobium plurifarium]